MAARPVWKGQLRLSLVSIPVEMFSATGCKARVRPRSSGLLPGTRNYADEIRKTDRSFASISEKPAEEDLLDLATALIEKKSGPFDPAAFEDHCSDAVCALVEEKMKGRKPRTVNAPERPRGGDNVIDLMDVLKKSLETSKPRPARKAQAARPATRTIARSPRRKSA